MSDPSGRWLVAWVVAVGYGLLAVTVFTAALLGTPDTSAGGVYLLLLAVPWSLLVLLIQTVLDIGPTWVAFALVSLGLLTNCCLLFSIARRQKR
jgi:hypothetical protein